MNTSHMKAIAAIVISAMLAAGACADVIDPSVGWEKTLWHGTREFRVLAYTNTTETYQFELPENVTWIDCLVVGGGGGGGGGWGGGGGGATSTGNNYTGGRGGDGIVIIRFEKPEANGFVIFVR